MFYDLDLSRLVDDLKGFEIAAGIVVDKARPGHGSRRADSRRNGAIALTVEAIEEATGITVKFSRSKEMTQWRFVNGPGKFVLRFMTI